MLGGDVPVLELGGSGGKYGGAVVVVPALGEGDTVAAVDEVGDFNVEVVTLGGEQPGPDGRCAVHYPGRGRRVVGVDDADVSVGGVAGELVGQVALFQSVAEGGEVKRGSSLT